MNAPNDQVSPTLAAAIIALDRKVSRAIDRRRGITLSADQLDVLAEIGCLDALATAKAAALTTAARLRNAKRTPRPVAPPPVDEDMVGEAAVRAGADAVAAVKRRRGRQPMAQ